MESVALSSEVETSVALSTFCDIGKASIKGVDELLQETALKDISPAMIREEILKEGDFN